jgi:hypothetical protein
MGIKVVANNGKYWSPSISTTNLIPHITLGFNKDCYLMLIVMFEIPLG